jgi:hypothetical protein
MGHHFWQKLPLIKLNREGVCWTLASEEHKIVSQTVAKMASNSRINAITTAALFGYARKNLGRAAAAPHLVDTFYRLAEREEIRLETLALKQTLTREQRLLKRNATELTSAITSYRKKYAWFEGERAAAAAAAGRIQLGHTVDELRHGTFKDGRQSSVRVAYIGLIEVRRGDLTGKELVAAGPRTFRSWNEWLTHLEGPTPV